jgi:hypothetical protein
MPASTEREKKQDFVVYFFAKIFGEVFGENESCLAEN